MTKQEMRVRASDNDRKPSEFNRKLDHLNLDFKVAKHILTWGVGTVIIIGYLIWNLWLEDKVQAQVMVVADTVRADTTALEGRVDTLEGNFQYIMGKLDAIADAVNAEKEE